MTPSIFYFDSKHCKKIGNKKENKKVLIICLPKNILLMIRFLCLLKYAEKEGIMQQEKIYQNTSLN
jgi:hypothetical protein